MRPLLAPIRRVTSQRFLAMSSQTPRPIVVSGPSGSGKSTLLNRLLEKYPNDFGFSISHTTRAPRGAEQNGKEYHFVTKDEFQDLVSKDGFIEHAQFGSNFYGTSKKAVEDIGDKGRICILDIEMEVGFLPRLCSFKHRY